MKRRLALLVLVTLLIQLATASGSAAIVPSILVNGRVESITPGPVVVDGQTLVPLRGFFEILGASVQWDNHSQTVKANRPGTLIRLTIGESQAWVNGSLRQLPVPVRLIGGITYIPLRFVSEALGAAVEWDEETIRISNEPARPAAFLVTRVVDGGTIEIDHNGVNEVIRLIGVEVPADGVPVRGGEELVAEAREFTGYMLENKLVSVEFDTQMTDWAGRLLAYVYLDDGTLVNVELVRWGYLQATITPPNVKYAARLAQAQVEAWENNRGLWGAPPLPVVEAVPVLLPLPEPALPAVEVLRKYVGSSGSDKFHKPSCGNVNRILEDNLIWFKDREDALAQGYIPCGTCKP